MLNDVKKLLGLNNTQFDTIITGWIESAKEDLRSVGIASSLIDSLETTPVPTDKKYQLVKTAVMTYCQSQFDSEKRELYNNSYEIQKDNLRKKISFQEPEEEEVEE